jgi:hypothetical protein
MSLDKKEPVLGLSERGRSRMLKGEGSNGMVNNWTRGSGMGMEEGIDRVAVGFQ